MRAGTTILLLAIVAGVGSFIYLKERHMSSTTQVAGQSDLYLELNQETVREVRVTSPRSEFHLKRTGAGWSVDGDVVDRADSEWVDSLIRELGGMQVIDQIGAEEIASGKFDLERAGLSPTPTTVEIGHLDGTRSVFLLGSEGSLEGTVHVTSQKGDGDGTISLVRSQIRDFTHGELAEIRDPQLWSGSPGLLRSVVYSGKQGEVELSRESDEDFWKIVRPLQTEANEDLMERITKLLAGIRAIKFVSGDEGVLPADPVDPAASVSVALFSAPAGSDDDDAEGQVVPTLTFWSAPGQGGEETSASKEIVYARSSDRPGVMQVDGRVWGALNLATNDFRNRTLARLNSDAIAQITVQSGSAPEVVIQREGGGWILLRSGRRARANRDRVDRLFKAINEHDILDFVSDSASSLGDFGLDTPFLRLGLSTGVDGPSETLLLGGKDQGIYAHWKGDPFVYRVSGELLPEIPTEAVKWKSLDVLQFSIFALRSLRISPGASPPLSLVYDHQFAKWSAQRAGKDISEAIDPAMAEAIASQLGSLRVSDWLADGAIGFAALQSPDLVVELGLQHGDGIGGSDKTIDLQLSFARVGGAGVTKASLHYGAIRGVPEVFLIRSEIVELLSRVPLRD